MRVVIVNPVWDRLHATPESTLARFTTLTGWAGAIRAQGAESVTVCQRFNTSAVMERHDVRYVFCGDRGRPSPRWSSRASRGLARTVCDAAPDVVHVNGLLFPEFVRGLRAALPSRTALVVQDHGGFDPDASSTFARIWIRRGLAAADAVLVASPGQADALRLTGIAPPDTLIADVMESSTTLRAMPREEARAATKLSGDPALLWVGRLNENKDPLTVLRGLATWFSSHQGATLTMAFQSGDLEGPVREFIRSEPALRNRVTLLGVVDHRALAAFYSAADLFVLGSHVEGSGYAAIEALACGAVPVVTDIAPFRALTGDGSVGALWEAGHAPSLTAALSRVMARPLDTQRDAGQALFERSFSWPTIGRRAVTIYREVMTSRALARG